MSNLALTAQLVELNNKFNKHSGFVVKGLGAVAAVAVGRYVFQIYSKTDGTKQVAIKENYGQKDKISVGTKFFKQLGFILKLLFPKLLSREVMWLFIHSATLVVRTFLSIYIAELDGRMVRSIVNTDLKQFVLDLSRWLAVAVPATFTNSAIRYCENKQALAFRSRLVNKAYSMYFKNQTYYRMNNMDTRIPNADQSLTDDITDFTTLLAHLYSHLTKPVLDIILISRQLINNAHDVGSASKLPAFVSFITTMTTVGVLRLLSPRFGQLIAERAKRNGYLRYIHSRVIQNAEEIAFYGGENVEHNLLTKCYKKVVEQNDIIYQKRLWYITLEQFFMKYVWSSAGLIMIAIPAITAKGYKDDADEAAIAEWENLGEGQQVSRRTEAFTFSRNLLVNSADALERIISSYKEVTELAGYVSRVYNMFHVFDDVSKGCYVRSSEVKDIDPELIRIAGDIRESDRDIILEDVPVITPNSDVVVRKLTLQVTEGTHLLITGPNGCGKSSLFRILSGLWPVYAGKLIKPSPSTMFYIPQRPYMTIGSLRDQVIYPDCHQDMLKKGITDEDLKKILETVHLYHVVTREGGWDSQADWKDVLSGGEKQRMGMARLFYHKPLYALLDECTSAVSIDVEGKIFEACKAAGIVLLTISHRPSLWKYHTHILRFDGEGGYSFSLLDCDTQLSLLDEKQNLEEQLGKIPTMQARLEEINTIMSTAPSKKSPSTESFQELNETSS